MRRLMSVPPPPKWQESEEKTCASSQDEQAQRPARQMNALELESSDDRFDRDPAQRDGTETEINPILLGDGMSRITTSGQSDRQLSNFDRDSDAH